jgi:hypothetical protein
MTCGRDKRPAVGWAGRRDSAVPGPRQSTGVASPPLSRMARNEGFRGRASRPLSRDGSQRGVLGCFGAVAPREHRGCFASAVADGSQRGVSGACFASAVADGPQRGLVSMDALQGGTGARPRSQDLQLRFCHPLIPLRGAPRGYVAVRAHGGQREGPLLARGPLLTLRPVRVRSGRTLHSPGRPGRRRPRRR